MSPPTREAGRLEGERLKREKTDAVDRRHHDATRMIQRAMVEFLIATPSGTTDDIRDAIDLPDEAGVKVWGSALQHLARAQIIRPTAFVISTRPERHAGPIREWCLAVRHEVAYAWLEAHPDRIKPPARRRAPKPARHPSAASSPPKRLDSATLQQGFKFQD